MPCCENIRPLRRLPADGWIGGVCAGGAYSLGVPVWLVRAAVAVATVLGAGLLIVIYIVLWILLPVERALPPDYRERAGDRLR